MCLYEDSIQKIKTLKRSDLLQPKHLNSPDNNLIPYVTKFNPHNPEIFRELQHNKSLLLKMTDRMKSMFKNKIFLKSKYQIQILRNRNLQ